MIVSANTLQSEIQKHYDKPVSFLFHGIDWLVVVDNVVVGTIHEILKLHGIDEGSFSNKEYQ